MSDKTKFELISQKIPPFGGIHTPFPIVCQVHNTANKGKAVGGLALV